MLKISGKIIYSAIGVVAGCALTVGLVTTNAARGSYLAESSEPSGSSATTSTISSSVPSSEESILSIVESSAPSSTVPVSSKTEIEKQTDSGVSRIQKATDSGVSKIEEATSKAVQEVQKAVSEPVKTGPVVACATNKITGESDYVKHDGTHATWDIECANDLSEVDEANKAVIINYRGGFDGNWEDVSELKAYGFALKNQAGENIDFEQQDFCRMKVPYQNLSDVSELYFTYQDQSIKITVS